MGRTTAKLCYLSQGRLLLDSVQPSLGWFRYFLGSQRLRNVGGSSQWSVDVWNAMGHPFCFDGAIRNLGKVLLRSMAEETYPLRGDGPPGHRSPERLEAANGLGLHRHSADHYQRRRLKRNRNLTLRSTSTYVVQQPWMGGLERIKCCGCTNIRGHRGCGRCLSASLRPPRESTNFQADSLRISSSGEWTERTDSIFSCAQAYRASGRAVEESWLDVRSGTITGIISPHP
jgi:hypothetical protein